MKITIKKAPFFILVFLQFLSGCEVGDNQLIIPSDRLEIANPLPFERDYKSINEKHKILMAVIDFGVDYNHPQLKENLHFSLDKKGRPVGLGYDFVGNDSWPSPFIVMTADVDPDASDAAKNSALQLTKHLKLAIDLFPELENKINPYRRIDQESDSKSIHGTHVAGLMTYDAPELGLLSYRVMPANQIYKEGVLQEDLSGQMAVSKNILSALEMAVKSGVKIINLSLAMEIKNQESPRDSIDYKNFDYTYKLVEKFIKSHPDVAFVAAAGNSGSWINRKTHRQLPCGINASNIICVGALDKDGNLASFSNIMLTKSPFILAPGVDIISTIAREMCQLKNETLNTDQSTDLLTSDDESPWNDPQAAHAFLEQVSSTCLANNGFTQSTGTSMASPIIARALAKLRVQYPLLNATEAISKLISMGKKVNEGPLTLTKLQVEMPSWYASEININQLTDPFFLKKKKKIPQSSKQYFEFKVL